MIIIKNGYTLSEGVQRDYTYSYQVTPSSLLRTVSAPAFTIYEDGNGNSALGLQTLQGDPVKLSYDEYPAGYQFEINSSEINITAISETGVGNLYFRWYTEYDEHNGGTWTIYRSYRYREGSTTTTSLGWIRGHPIWRITCTDIITQKNNYENTIYPVARDVHIHWRGNTGYSGADNYLYSQKRRVLLSSQSISRTDYLYTVTGGIVTT